MRVWLVACVLTQLVACGDGFVLELRMTSSSPITVEHDGQRQTATEDSGMFKVSVVGGFDDYAQAASSGMTVKLIYMNLPAVEHTFDAGVCSGGTGWDGAILYVDVEAVSAYVTKFDCLRGSEVVSGQYD